VNATAKDAAFAACATAGLDLDRLLAAADEVVVFGSHAVGAARPGSDVDLLCIGSRPGQTHRSRALDLIWLSREEPTGRAWLGSELGAHVARYGHWLKGRGAWKRLVRVSPDAIRRKGEVVHARTSALAEGWDRLSPLYRIKNLTRIRQELQRLEYLRRGEGCPPTPILDAEWARRPQATR